MDASLSHIPAQPSIAAAGATIHREATKSVLDVELESGRDVVARTPLALRVWSFVAVPIARSTLHSTALLTV
jgi:hypothetical protein